MRRRQFLSGLFAGVAGIAANIIGSTTMPSSSSSSSESPAPEQYIGTNYSHLCSTLNRPLLMTGIFRDVLTRHFVSIDYIEEPDLRHLIWKEGETSGILIESIHRWRPELTEHRPAVIVKRNSYQNQRRGIGDRRLGPHTDAEGFEHFVTFWVGSHTLFCIGGSGAQAELLGTEVQRELTQFGPELSKKLDLKRFQVTQVGVVSELEEAQENFVVPVTVGYAYEERWVIRPQVPKLSNVSLSMIIEC